MYLYSTVDGIVWPYYVGSVVMLYGQLAVSRLAEGEVLIRAEATRVNYVDTICRNGQYPTVGRTPLILGIEDHGRIEAFGPMWQ